MLNNRQKSRKTDFWLKHSSNTAENTEEEAEKTTKSQEPRKYCQYQGLMGYAPMIDTDGIFFVFFLLKMCCVGYRVTGLNNILKGPY